MDKMLVVVFDSETKAYEGSRILRELDAEGSLTLYAVAVVAKDANGTVTVKQAADEGPVGTAVGLLTGSLIGVLGGPVGVAIGAAAGTLGGALYDTAKLGVGEDFLSEVARNLQPGRTAVLAEVWEEWVMPVDSRMEAAGGVVFRRVRGEVVDAQISRDVAALKAEVAGLKAEYQRASGAARAKLQTRIDAAKAKLLTIQERAKAASDAAEKETAAKVKYLQEHVAKAQGEAKTKLEARIAQVRTESKQRLDKLHQAWELTKQALAV
jgi:uncharacterized membrane protein